MDLNNIEILPSSTRPIKKCSKCGSIYITSKECESCGLQFNPHELGEVLGPKSFFSLKEDFENDKRIWENKNSIRFKNYRKKLIHRFRNLLEALEYSWDDLDSWNIFNYELLEICRYLASFKDNKNLLNRILLEKRDHPGFFQLNKIAHEGPRPETKIYPYPFKKSIYFFVTLILIISISYILNKFYFI